MNPIKSPLAAVGGFIFLIDAAVLGALGLVDDPGLQKVIVWSLVASMFLVIAMVWWMLWYILVKLKSPVWLFNPADIDASAHLEIYAGSQRHDALTPDLTSLEVDED